MLCNLELERKITDLQKELKKKVEVNEALHGKVNLLSELKSLPSEVEMLRKEVNTFFKQITLILMVKLNKKIQETVKYCRFSVKPLLNFLCFFCRKIFLCFCFSENFRRSYIINNAKCFFIGK